MAIILKAKLDIVIFFLHKFLLFDPLTTFDLSELKESPMIFFWILKSTWNFEPIPLCIIIHMPESDAFSLQKFKGSRLNENNLSWGRYSNCVLREYIGSGEDVSVNTVSILRNWWAILADLQSLTGLTPEYVPLYLLENTCGVDSTVQKLTW